MRRRVMGPPGTGKTTYLMGLIDKHLEGGMPSHQIGFFSFTRSAVQEAKDRAFKKFGLGSKQLPYFRTLHSQSMKGLDARPALMNPEHWREFIREHGLWEPRPHEPTIDEMEQWEIKRIVSSSPIIRLVTRSLAEDRKVDDIIDGTEVNYTDLEEAEYIQQAYLSFKRTRSLYDYSDLLRLFLEKGQIPDFGLICIDEAQDLSPQLWQVAQALENKSALTVYAGDDDQAIFTYDGATPNEFRDMDAPTTVLSQSYRVPEVVHSLAQRVIKRVPTRFEKDYAARPEAGHTETVSRWEDLPLGEGQWLILAWSRRNLASMSAYLKGMGYAHYDVNGSQFPNEKLAKAIQAWINLGKGLKIHVSEAQALYKCIVSGEYGVGRGGYKAMEDATLQYGDDHYFSLKDLQDEFRFTQFILRPWNTVMKDVRPEDVDPINTMIDAGHRLTAKPRISLKTIHQAKGTECANVALYNAIPNPAYKAWRDGDTAIHQVMYVAVTRASESLYIVDPGLRRRYDFEELT